MDRPRLPWIHALCLTFVLPCALGLLGCGGEKEKKKAAEDDSAEESPKKAKKGKDEDKPLVDKPMGSLSKEEMGELCKKLGWSNSGVSFSSSGGSSNIIASCTKEDPNGTDSPDGKKRARLTIALYTSDNLAAEVPRQDERGAAYAVDEKSMLSVSLHTKSKPDAQKILVTLLGEAAAKKTITAPAGPASAATTPPAASASAPAPTTTADGSADKPFVAGDPCDINYQGSWWKGEVKAVKPGPLYHVHYVGWDASWDEWVGPKRVRGRTEGSRTK